MMIKKVYLDEQSGIPIFLKQYVNFFRKLPIYIAGGVKVYFYAEFDKEFASFGTYENDLIKPNFYTGIEGRIKQYNDIFIRCLYYFKSK